MSAAPKSALYTGHVLHHRFRPGHSFRYRVAMCLLDLDEVGAVMAQHPFWSTGRGRPVQFRRADYLGGPESDLKSATWKLAKSALGHVGEGPVSILSQLRTWGWCFNPISIYYCSDENDRLTAAVASVTNTPWGERHDYVLKAEDDRIEAWVPKALHVSPFIEMDRTYHFFLSAPRQQIHARVQVLEGNEVSLTTALHLTRKPLDRLAMTSLLVSYPFMAWRVSAAIYWQAAQLWRKGAHVLPHPRHGLQPRDLVALSGDRRLRPAVFREGEQ